MPCTPFSVDLEVITPDQLKKITFGLEKACNPNNTETWTIHFELDEAASAGATFNEVVKLDISVDPQNNASAATTAANGLTPSQTAQALVAGDTAKAVSQGTATNDDLADDAQAVLTA